MTTKRLVLFGKLPRLRRVKTRLVPPLTAGQALRLYRAFLVDQLDFLRRFRSEADVEWCADGVLESEDEAGFCLDGLHLTLQGPGNLGTRLLRTFRRTRREGSRVTVIVGADSPTLPATHVQQAFRVLERGASAVIAPANDGGYVLIGLREPIPELFRDVAWGEAEVAETTRARAAEIGLQLEEIEPWYDVDEISELHRLRRELCRPGAPERAPTTRRYLLDWELPPVV